jgi:hypothetical protein
VHFSPESLQKIALPRLFVIRLPDCVFPRFSPRGCANRGRPAHRLVLIIH